MIEVVVNGEAQVRQRMVGRAWRQEAELAALCFFHGDMHMAMVVMLCGETGAWRVLLCLCCHGAV